MSTLTFRVRFTEWRAFATDIVAESPQRAIEVAKDIRNFTGTLDFEEFDRGDENWEAEEIDLAALEIDQLATALTRLREAAADLLSAIDGATDQFDDNTREVAEAIATVDLVLLNQKGGAR